MKGHPGHRDAFGSLSQRNAEDPVRQLGVVVKQLVKVAHAKQQDTPGVLLLEPVVLLHRRRLVDRLTGFAGTRRLIIAGRLSHRRCFTPKARWCQHRRSGPAYKRGCRFSDALPVLP